MSRPDFDVREQYIGAGNLDTYSFDFKISNLDQLLVIVYDDDGDLVGRFRGTDSSFLDSVTFDPNNGGGNVVLLADLAAGWQLTIFLADDAPTQPFEFKGKFSFTMERIEAAFDWLSGQIQRLSYLGGRTIKLNDRMSDAEVADFDPQMPYGLVDNPGATIAVNDTGDGITFGPTTEEINLAVTAAEAAQAYAEAAAASADASAQSAAESAAGAGTPPGGETGAVLTKISPTDNDTYWEPLDYDGISALTGQQFTHSGIKDVLDAIVRITYTPPQISFSASGSGTLRERGDLVSASNLQAILTKKSNDIGAVRFYQGASLLSTVSSPNPAGGTENYAWSGTPFGVNTTFSAQVDDVLTGGNQTIGVTASATFQFVYPYFVGAGAVGANVAAVQAMTKLIINSTATLARSITATAGQVFYLAYPQSYGALTSILDVNNFETFGDWTRTTRSFTGLDGNPVSYYVYEFNNPVTAGSYQYTFKR